MDRHRCGSSEQTGPCRQAASVSRSDRPGGAAPPLTASGGGRRTQDDRCVAAVRPVTMIPLLITIMLLLSFSRTLPASGAVPNEESQTCLGCHDVPGMVMTFGDRTTLPVRVNGQQFASSAHGPLGCAGCHPDVSLASHPSAQYASKQQFLQHLAGVCRNCHSDDQLMANPQHQRVISGADARPCTGCHGAHAVKKASARKEKISVSQYCLTCHSKPLTRSIDGKTVSLTIDEAWIKGSVHPSHECTDCHRAYSKGSHPSPKGNARGREVTHAASETCERCHFDKAVKEKDSIHAVLLAEGDQRAPGCSDCHGAHRVGPGALADTLDGVPCRKCHQESFDAYRTSVHGMSKPTATRHRPLCAACHTAHTVKPAMASRSPRDMCLSCHPSYEQEHGQRLPNPKAHLEMVACTACHVPLNYKRSIYLRLTEAATGRLLSDSEVQTLLKARGVTDRQIGSRELWQLYRDLNAAKAVNVAVAVSMDVRRNAHYLAPKDIAVQQCEKCHSANSSFFQTVAVAAADADGREVLHDVDPRVLESAYGVILLKRFYVMSGTRLTAMDYAGVVIILGGMAFPVVHGTARLMTRHLRRGTKRPEGRGKP